MSFKKRILAVAAAGALTAATAVPAFALENEFHGMFRAFGFVTNGYTGGTGPVLLAKDAKTNSYVEQRARVQYIAKANDNLRLVTHFELDSRWGGVVGGYKGTTGNDTGQVDADSLSLETKNVFIDFNCPLTGAKVGVGIQPLVDSYKSVFFLVDAASLVASKKFDAFTGTFAFARLMDSTNQSAAAGATAIKRSGQLTTDLIVLDGKFAASKDLTVGVSYYNVANDGTAVPYELLHMLGVNVASKVGPAAIDAFLAYQFGDNATTAAAKTKLSGLLAGATLGYKVGSGKVNAALLYLSGDDGKANTDNTAFQVIGANFSYFNPANMWLLIRNGATINSSSAIGNNDLTKGNRGLIGVFAGYEGAVNKVFYSANLGYAQIAKKFATDNDSGIGTEINATVGYKMFDNLSVSATAAYAMLGDFAKKGAIAARTANGDATNPYMTNVQFNYTF